MESQCCTTSYLTVCASVIFTLALVSDRMIVKTAYGSHILATSSYYNSTLDVASAACTTITATLHGENAYFFSCKINQTGDSSTHKTCEPVPLSFAVNETLPILFFFFFK